MLHKAKPGVMPCLKFPVKPKPQTYFPSIFREPKKAKPVPAAKVVLPPISEKSSNQNPASHLPNLSQPKVKSHRYDAYVSNGMLNLQERDLTARDVPELLVYLSNHPEIKKINLKGNKLKAEGAMAFARGNATVTYVNLSDNGLSSRGAVEFIKTNTTATHVILSENCISNNGVYLIGLYNRVVTHMDLSFNNIGADGAIAFAKSNNTVAKLNLSQNYLCDEGLIGFAQYNRAVKDLDVSFNNISDEGITYRRRIDPSLFMPRKGEKPVLGLLELNKVIEKINLGFNKISSFGVKIIEKSSLSVTGLNSNNAGHEEPVVAENIFANYAPALKMARK